MYMHTIVYIHKHKLLHTYKPFYVYINIKSVRSTRSDLSGHSCVICKPAEIISHGQNSTSEIDKNYTFKQKRAFTSCSFSCFLYYVKNYDLHEMAFFHLFSLQCWVNYYVNSNRMQGIVT